ncbi:hypothetical protein [Bradyrhizobium phage BDU-MI-1]|nr:hypothetical protein [Bradyrhizobium phage BDU-MI-1]
MDPSANAPYHFLGAAAEADTTVEQQPAPAVTTEVVTAEAPPLNGEVLPPQTPPVAAAEPQYPIGLIDFNQPIVVLDNDDYNDEAFDSPAIVTVLKGSLHPVVITFWKHGEQCVDQFDTDGDSASGNHKVEQELIYPATRYVVIGRDGRNLIVDEELYASEEEANDKTSIEDVAGIFPVVIEAPAPTLADDVAGAGSVHDGIDEDEGEGIESEDDEENEVEDSAAPVAPAAPAIHAPDAPAPTEMYVAGRMRRVGDTVHACRGGITRVCTITKMRHNATKSLCLHPHDGSPDYWAWNKNVRY